MVSSTTFEYVARILTSQEREYGTIPFLTSMKVFDPDLLKKLYIPPRDSSGEQNGQVTIIGGSTLFHGAPIFSLTAASRVVDMVFFASPEPSMGEVASQIKSRLSSFIWVPWVDVESYIAKSDAVLIGPGFMRFSSESQTEESRLMCDAECQKTRTITTSLLSKFPEKKWVIDAGSLQVLEPELLPKGCIITPNKKEFEELFKIRVKEQESERVTIIEQCAEKYGCTIVYKGPETIVTNGNETFIVKGGNAGLTKGGTGDTLAGLTVALYAKNESVLAASAATYILKKTAEKLEKTVGTNFNADDVSGAVFTTYHELIIS